MRERDASARANGELRGRKQLRDVNRACRGHTAASMGAGAIAEEVKINRTGNSQVTTARLRKACLKVCAYGHALLKDTHTLRTVRRTCAPIFNSFRRMV